MIKTKIILARFSHDGRLLERREQESRSWIRHFFDLLYPIAAATDLPLINDIGAVPRELCSEPASNALNTGPSPNLVVGSTPGNIQQLVRDGAGSAASCAYKEEILGEDIGIVVGTGGGGPTPTDDKLATKILHGETAGTLLYGGTELYGLTFAGPNGQFTIRRYLTNVLGGNILVTEAGIYSPGMSTTGGTAYLFCIARDVFGAVTVANTEILMVTYVVQITV
ncbi:hypothetical protein ES708_10229 [subsurface metagenome]